MNQVSASLVCPRCRKDLPEIQIKNMTNLEYNEWFRNGYCSWACWSIEDSNISSDSDSKTEKISPNLTRTNAKSDTPHSAAKVSLTSTAYPCPMCNHPVKPRVIGAFLPFNFSILGFLLGRALGLYECPDCGPIPSKWFTPEVMAQMQRDRRLWVILSAVFIPVIGCIIYLILR